MEHASERQFQDPVRDLECLTVGAFMSIIKAMATRTLCFDPWILPIHISWLLGVGLYQLHKK